MAKIVMALTQIDEYKTNPLHKTGVWLEEAVSFYYEITKAGHEVIFASTKGGIVPIDPKSIKFANDETITIFKSKEFSQKIENTVAFNTLNKDDFKAIYFCGGHGAMWDFPNNKDLANLAQDIYQNNGYITSVCHGEAGLVGLKAKDGTPLVKGVTINGFTNEEEILNGMQDFMPFMPEDELKKLGGNFIKGEPYTEFAVSDKRFITGQNPMSSKKVARLLIEALKG